jgi:hypothetical protein
MNKLITTRTKFAAFLPLCVVLESCSFFGPSETLKATSKALLTASEQCVYEVRDKNLKYEKAPSCTALGALSQQYINAGGGQPDAPVEVDIDFERARVDAWMALALSESKEPALLRIW